MFSIIFTTCTFAAVKSQASFNFPYSGSSQSVSYSGPGSSSFTSTSYSGPGTSYVSNGGFPVSSPGSLPALSPSSTAQLLPIFPPVLDSKIESFAHSLTQVLLYSTVLNAVNFVITDSYTFLYQIGRIILEREGVLDPSLAQLAGEAGRQVGVITKDLYYNTITHMFAKLLYLNNLLTQETVLTYPTAILRFVEDYGIKNGIFDTESVLKAVTNGVLDFATSIGVNNVPNLTKAFQLFAQDLKALASGVEV